MALRIDARFPIGKRIYKRLQCILIAPNGIWPTPPKFFIKLPWLQKKRLTPYLSRVIELNFSEAFAVGL